MIIMQLSTLVLKEDNPLHYFKHLSRVTLHVKLLLADFKAFSYHMTVGACAGHKTLLIPFWAWTTNWKVVAFGTGLHRLRVRMPRVRITHLITFTLYACGLGSKLLLAILILCQVEHQLGQLGSRVVLCCNIHWETSGQNPSFYHTYAIFLGSLKKVFCH